MSYLHNFLSFFTQILALNSIIRSLYRYFGICYSHHLVCILNRRRMDGDGCVYIYRECICSTFDVCLSVCMLMSIYICVHVYNNAFNSFFFSLLFFATLGNGVKGTLFIVILSSFSFFSLLFLNYSPGTNGFFSLFSR